jgi:hypothetical protein
MPGSVWKDIIFQFQAAWGDPTIAKDAFAGGVDDRHNGKCR